MQAPRQRKLPGRLDCQETSQSLRPQARKKSGSFSAAACTSPKILYALQVWNFCAKGAKIMRAAWRKPFQTRTQRSGSRLSVSKILFLTRSTERTAVRSVSLCAVLSAIFRRQQPVDLFKRHRKAALAFIADSLRNSCNIVLRF